MKFRLCYTSYVIGFIAGLLIAAFIAALKSL